MVKQSNKNFNNKYKYQLQRQLYKSAYIMSVGHRKRIVSIDVELNQDQPKQMKQNPIKKHKLTIIVESNDNKNKRISIRDQSRNSCENEVNGAAPSADQAAQKYYFNRNTQKCRGKRSQIRGIVTQRKHQKGTTLLLQKDKSHAKSYRIHTIDYVEEDNKKDQPNEFHQHQKSLNSMVGATNKKSNYIGILKNKIKKKSIINQSDLIDFTTRTKITQRVYKKQGEEQTSTGAKHRRLIKSKTEFEEPDENNVGKENKQNKIIKYLLSERNTTADILSRPNEAKPLKNLIIKLNKSQKSTVQLKKIKISHQRSHQQIQQNNDIGDDANVEENQKQVILNKNSSFNKYLEFINKRHNRQNIVNKARTIRNLPEGRSLIVKSVLLKQTIQLKQPQQLKIQNQQKMKQFLSFEKKIGIAERQEQTKLESENIYEKIDGINIFKCNQFDFSAIPQVNQSSFLSESAKKQIVQTNTFCLPDFRQLINKKDKLSKQTKQKKQKNGISYQLKQSPSRRKNKKRRQSKMSLICRSQIKQAFPERFFA